MTLPANPTAAEIPLETPQASDLSSEPCPPFSVLLADFPSLVSSVQRLGFDRPTTVQSRTLPRALMGENLVIEARTGSGKTLTYSLPLAAHILLHPPVRHTLAIVMTPTRELAVQVAEVIESLDTSLRPVSLIGGASIERQVRAMSEDGRIVIGTPGRILDMMRRRILSVADVSFFALDEADEMLSMGFIEDVEHVLRRIPRSAHGLFTSATVNERVKMLAKQYMKRFALVEIDDSDNATLSSGTIHHYFCKVGSELLAKAHTLMAIIERETIRSTIVFCNTKSDTDFLEALLSKKGVKLEKINSDLNQAKRNKVIGGLKAGEFNLLIATDVAARGLDIDHIDLVINYSLHDHPETYVHRTGRTGRAGREGMAISLVAPRDFIAFHHLKKELSVEFEEYQLPK